MRVLDFYFDYLSPYAYLASLEVGELCAGHGVELQLRPVLFAGLLEHWGQKGPAEIPSKGRHALRQCVRTALVRGVPLRSPRFHPFRPLTALRVSLAEVAGDAQPRVIQALFAHGWGHGGDLGDDAEIAAALDAAGLDARALLARAAEPDMKDCLRSETALAVARGVFGIPTMIVDDELFWGLDQLPYVDLFLDGNDPLQSVDFEALLSKGRGAWRTGVAKPPPAR